MRRPASRTALQAMRPFSVIAALTEPDAVSSPRTAQDEAMVAPARRAATAMAGTANCGSAHPSVCVKSAPAQRRDEPGRRRSTSAEFNSRELT